MSTAVIILFLSLHWQFAAHYLQSALLFKATITEHAESLLKEIERKKKRLKVTEAAVYCTLLTFAAVFCIISDTDNWLLWFEIFWLSSEVSMTMATLWAMRSIHMSSSAL
mmetsp:Transcript_6957/g.8374  ORF Transcript_6957/g.8374 Transcript_6957/m.8374 type:complete len:110 (+) Transcript_6957:347-676(+)